MLTLKEVCFLSFTKMGVNPNLKFIKCLQDKNAGEVVVILEPAPTQDEDGTNQTKSPSRRKQHILAKVKRQGQIHRERET